VACTLYLLGFAAFLAGDMARAARGAQVSLEHNPALGTTRVMALWVLAAHQQQVDRGARLFAVAEALSNAANYHLPPRWGPRTRRPPPRSRQCSAASAFEEAWAAARMLPLDDGVAFAMGAEARRQREQLPQPRRSPHQSVS